MTPTGSSGTLVEDAAIQRESEDAPVITIVHCPPYVSSAVTSFNDTLDVAGEWFFFLHFFLLWECVLVRACRLPPRLSLSFSLLIRESAGVFSDRLDERQAR